MPLQRNAWVNELLTWHGHSTGGVRVPFASQGGNPLSQTIVTRLVERLRLLARQIALAEEAPRWVFLIGGPGNGKSEAVQDFLLRLDDELGCQGILVDLLRERFTPSPLIQWRVVLDAQSAQALPSIFHERIGRLVVVQDASASEDPRQDAASILVDSILDLLTTPPHQSTVFICCVNRGLLARSLKQAAKNVKKAPEYQEVIDLLKQLIRSTSLGKDVLVSESDRPSCWPLEHTPLLSGKIACWPLDMESLLLAPAHGGINPSPLEQIFTNASHQDKWEVAGACLDCDVAHLCPFRQNAIWLREPNTRTALLQVLRRGELAIGQRWNFRDTFSLAAELVVGEWGDFANYTHPCEWVHYHASQCESQPKGTKVVDSIRSLYFLLTRLYPHALFPGSFNKGGLPHETHRIAQKRHLTYTLAIETCVTSPLNTAQTHIRSFLREKLLSKIDTALSSPHDPSELIGAIEDSYNQSVAMGNDLWMNRVAPSEIERRFFYFCREAEDEWDHLSRESAQVSIASKFLRVLCSSFAKRSAGLRKGSHANEVYLQDYETVLRNEDALAELTDALRSLLGERGFHFNILESFGQPQSENEWLVALEGSAVSIHPIIAAPIATPSTPAHDVPFIPIASQAIPLTFDLYLALRLRQDGCTSGSLPASVRASLDRIRHLQAGELSHQEVAFSSGLANYRIQGRGTITLPREKGIPRFRRS